MAEHSWTPGDPVVIDLVRRPAAEVAWVLVFAGGFLLWATFAAVPVEGPSTRQLAMAGAGALCLSTGLVQLARRLFGLRVRGLFVEPGGIALEESGGRSWSVSWDELASVSIATERRYGREWLAIDLVPAAGGVAFEARHPELARLKVGGAGELYRLPIAPGGKHFVALERGLVLHAGARYREPGP